MNLLTKAGYRVSHFIIASIIDWLLQAVSIDKQSQKGHSGELGIVFKLGGLPPDCVFADLNLAVWNSITIHTCTWYKFWRILIWRFRLKPPNRQISWLYGNVEWMLHWQTNIRIFLLPDDLFLELNLISYICVHTHIHNTLLGKLKCICVTAERLSTRQ